MHPRLVGLSRITDAKAAAAAEAAEDEADPVLALLSWPALGSC